MHRRIATVALLGLALAAPGCDSATENATFFQATLAGSNEVPPVGTAASGTCGFILEGDQVRYTIEVHGLNPVIGAHIHPGAAGVNGPVRVVLFPFPGGPVITTATQVEGILMASTFNNSHVTGGLSFNDIVSAMRSGNAYCNVHTTRFPGGEIRGQIAEVATN